MERGASVRARDRRVRDALSPSRHRDRDAHEPPGDGVHLALAHLTEIPDDYTRLANLEHEAAAVPQKRK